MESRFNVGDKVVFLKDNARYVEDTIEKVMVNYMVKVNDTPEMTMPNYVAQEGVFKNKKEVIEKLGLND